MLTKDEHLAKARDNESFADRLGLDVAVDVGWAITALFYSAVHYVQCYFVASGRDFMTHTTRGNAIQRDPHIKIIYDDYRELESMSREARYDCTTFSQGHVKYAKEKLAIVRETILRVLGI